MRKNKSSVYLSIALALSVVAFITFAVRLTVTAATATVGHRSLAKQMCLQELEYCD